MSSVRSFCRRAYAALAGGKNICPLLKNFKKNQIGYRNVGRVSWKVFHIWHGKMMRYSNFIQKAQVQKLDTVYSRLLNITCLGNFNFPVISLNDILIIEVYFRLFSKMVNHVHLRLNLYHPSNLLKPKLRIWIDTYFFQIAISVWMKNVEKTLIRQFIFLF